MKTEVIMVRKVLKDSLLQKSKSGLINATNLVSIANKLRDSEFNLTRWLQTESTKEYIHELEKHFEKETILKKVKGRSGGTYMHLYLARDLAFALHPRLKIEMNKILDDSLLSLRNETGDGYKQLSSAIMKNMDNPDKFQKPMMRLAIKIKNKCGVKGWNEASESQLKFRNNIQNDVIKLTNLMSNDKAIKLAFAMNDDKTD